MTLMDHLLTIVLVIVYPVVGYLSFKRLLRRIEAGEAVERSKLYQQTAAGHWTLFFVALALWYSQGRAWVDIGFGPGTGTGFLVGVLLTLAAIVFLVMQIRQVAASEIDEVRLIRNRLGKVDVILPRNGNELGRFYGLALTAGIVEETLWRGFIIWYFGQLLPLWVAVSISIIGFGLAHAYQGIDNLPKITLISALFAGLYLLTGSLWLPMALHAAVDILQGRLAYDVIRRTGIAAHSAPEKGEAIAPSAS